VGVGGANTGLAPLGTVLLVLASIGTFAYSARYYLRTFEGPERTPAHRAPAAFELPALLLAVVGLGIGLLVPRLDRLVNGVAVAATGTDPDLHLALWHGFTTPLVLTTVVVAVGLALVVRRGAVEALQGRISLPSNAVSFDRTYDATLRFGAWVGRVAVSNRPPMYLLPVLAVVLTVGITASIGLDITGAPAPSLRADWAIVILLAASILGVAQAKSRLAAVAKPMLLPKGDASPPHFAPVVDKLEATCPTAEVQTFRGAGHIPHMTHPDAFVEAVTAFIRSGGRA
jgi:multicomponent Na+:H+ antiporter subunit A